MNGAGLRFHHLDLAARRPRDAMRFLGGLGYDIPEPVFDPEQNVNLILCRGRGTMPDVEIVYPAGAKSPADAWMEQSGVRAVCMAPPTPAVLFGVCPVAFYNIVGLGLCEIIEDPHRTVA